MEGVREGRRAIKVAILHNHRASSAIFFQKAGEDWTDVWLRVLSAVERTPLGVVVGRVCHVVGRIVDLAEPQERPWHGTEKGENKGPRGILCDAVVV